MFKIFFICDKDKYFIGEEATCVIKGTTDEDIISVSGAIKVVDENFDIVATSSEIWEGDADDGNVQLYTDEEKTGTFEIGTLKIKAKKDFVLAEGKTQNVELSVSNIKVDETLTRKITVEEI